MKAYIICVILVASATPWFASAQALTLTMTDLQPRYELITHVVRGSTVYCDDETISSDNIAGFSYRLIVSSFSIYDDLFVEKLLVNIEGIPSQVEWASKLDMRRLMINIDVHPESQQIENLSWIDETSFEFMIGSRSLRARILAQDSLSILIIKD